MSSGEAAKSDRSFKNILSTALSLNFVGIVLALLLEATFSNLTPLQIAGNFIDSFFYANYIGTLFVFAVLNFTPHLNCLSFPLRWGLLVGMILGLTFIGSLMAGFTLMWIGSFPPDDYSWITLRRMGLGFLIALVLGISLYSYETVRLKLRATTERLRAKEAEEELAQKLALEASLSSLESRIHPHFVFNTLNSISSLVQEDPPLAERMVERLASLLRFSLDSNHRSTIPLEQELKIAIDYLEIERARFGERLQYRVDVPTELKTVRVPPFIIQTLVENSVKYVVSVEKQGGEIQIKARAADKRLEIEVRDNGAGFTPDAIIEGHGLDNLRARLFALFDTEAALKFSKKDGYMTVSISLPNHQLSGRSAE
jgi:sensor histidine kinase YesM